VKKINIALMALFVGLAGCANSKPEPKICKVTIAEPSQAELNKANATQPKRACHKRETLWSQFGIN